MWVFQQQTMGGWDIWVGDDLSSADAQSGDCSPPKKRAHRSFSTSSLSLPTAPLFSHSPFSSEVTRPPPLGHHVSPRCSMLPAHERTLRRHPLASKDSVISHRAFRPILGGHLIWQGFFILAVTCTLTSAKTTFKCLLESQRGGIYQIICNV